MEILNKKCWQEYEEFTLKYGESFMHSPNWAKVKTAWKCEIIVSRKDGEIVGGIAVQHRDLIPINFGNIGRQIAVFQRKKLGVIFGAEELCAYDRTNRQYDERQRNHDRRDRLFSIENGYFIERFGGARPIMTHQLHGNRKNNTQKDQKYIKGSCLKIQWR